MALVQAKSLMADLKKSCTEEVCTMPPDLVLEFQVLFVLRCGVVWCGVVRCGAVWYGATVGMEQ